MAGGLAIWANQTALEDVEDQRTDGFKCSDPDLASAKIYVLFIPNIVLYYVDQPWVGI